MEICAIAGAGSEEEAGLVGDEEGDLGAANIKMSAVRRRGHPYRIPALHTPRTPATQQNYPIVSRHTVLFA